MYWKPSAANKYRLYPCPQTPTCNPFLWLALWIKWVEHMHLGCPMSQTDFVFPLLGPNGVLQPGKVLSHETIQKLLNEATTRAGIPGTFSTHCFRRGGAQYYFMLSPKPWLLKRVHWWDGWAEGEQVSIIYKGVCISLCAFLSGVADTLTDLSVLCLLPLPFPLFLHALRRIPSCSISLMSSTPTKMITATCSHRSSHLLERQPLHNQQ